MGIRFPSNSSWLRSFNFIFLQFLRYRVKKKALSIITQSASLSATRWHPVTQLAQFDTSEPQLCRETNRPNRENNFNRFVF